MQQFARAVLASVVGGLVLAGITEFLGRSLYDPSPTIAVLGNPYIRYGLYFVIFALLLYKGVGYVRQRREEIVSNNTSRAWVVTSKPKNVEYTSEIEQYGVLWKGLYGTRSQYATSRDDRYVYVEGPFCPEDKTELDRRTVPKWFVFDQRAWVCPLCEKTYPRPRKHMYNERDNMEKIFERVFEEELENRGARHY